MSSEDIVNASRALARFGPEWMDSMLKAMAEMQTPEYKKCSHDLGYLWFLTVDQFWYFYGGYKGRADDSGWGTIESFFSIPETVSTISELVSSHDLLNRRREAVERGLKAHLEADYIASISILLPQVEGIVWDIGIARGLVSPAYNSKKRLNGKGDWTFHELVFELWKKSPSDTTYTRFLEKMKKEYYSEGFRHPLLHGRDVTQFNKKRSTEVVLLIWAVSEKA